MGGVRLGEQYDQFISCENFRLAYVRLKTVTRNTYKEFYFEDFRIFEAYFDLNIEELLHQVQEGIYEPSSSERYYMPKKKNLARPITMITLIDQIVYQAIANVIADVMHPSMSRYFNNNIFGNLFKTTTAERPEFFYEMWKKQWKKYNERKKKAYEDGFEYVADFDIASFYDTIDHRILRDILLKSSVEPEIIDLLVKCLTKWTLSPTSTLKLQRNSGIPQGPVSSAFFAEVYLFCLDNVMRTQQKIHYFRYADDICIMAKNEQDCQKRIVYLDLLARELSLVPQSEKVGVSRILDIDAYVKNSKLQFSRIANEHKRVGALKSKTHRKVKSQFLSCFEDNPKNFDKGIIRFALYKLNEDEEVEQAIINNIALLEPFYEGIVFYFNRYPSNAFHTYVNEYLMGDAVLFQYNKAAIFRGYTHLPFDESIYRENCKENKPFWIVQYHLIAWLLRNEQAELAAEISCENYYIRREVNKIKCVRYSNEIAKQQFIESLIANPDPMISLQGLYFLSNQFPSANVNCPPTATTGYAQRILSGTSCEYIAYIFRSAFELEIVEPFLHRIQAYEDIYHEAKTALGDFFNCQSFDPSKSLLNLNIFNNIVFDILKEDKQYNGEFGKSMNVMQADFPLAFLAFDQINSARNQKTMAHYKDKAGATRVRISPAAYKALLASANLREAYAEIMQYYQSAGGV